MQQAHCQTRWLSRPRQVNGHFPSTDSVRRLQRMYHHPSPVRPCYIAKMQLGSRRRVSMSLLLCAAVLLCASGASAAAPSRNKQSKKNTKSKLGNLDRELSRVRTQCGGDNTVVQPCVDEQIDVDNCIMKCVSRRCFDQTFSEPLELGEIAFDKNNKFKRCAKEDIRNAKLKQRL